MLKMNWSSPCTWRTFSSLLPLMHQYPVISEGLHKAWQTLGFQFTWDLYQARYPQVTALNSLSCHIPCVQPGAIPGILDRSSRGIIYHHLSTIYTAAPQRWQLRSLHKACPGEITEWGIILWFLAVNLHFPKMLISYWRHKGKTAENCCLLSDCSLKTPLSIKEGKYCSLQVYGSHQSRDELQGQTISCFTDECSEAQEENEPGAKKKSQNQPQTPIQPVPGGLCRLRALMSLIAAVGARAGSCQALAKTFPWYPLALPELRAEVSISTPRGCEGEMGHRAGPKKGAGTHSPCLADRDCFLFQLICKICYVETSFFATAFYIKNRCLRDLTVLVSRGC